MSNKTALFLIYIAIGLPMIAWPFVMYMTAFLFDEPHVSLANEVTRTAIGISVLAYPVFYIGGVIWGYKALNKGMPRMAILRPLPIILVPVAIVIAGFMLLK